MYRPPYYPHQHMYGGYQQPPHGYNRQAFPSPPPGPQPGDFGAMPMEAQPVSFSPPAPQPEFAEPPSNLPAILPAGDGAALDSAAAPAKGGGFSLGNLNEIKGFVDRMGGIDGILNTMTKVQKVVGSVQQFAPLMKVLMGSFGSKKGAASTASDSGSDGGEWRPPSRRRRRRRRAGGSGRTPSGRPRRRRRY